MALGTDHARRLALRERLKAVRLTCPLFDTRRWVAGAGSPPLSSVKLRGDHNHDKLGYHDSADVMASGCGKSCI